MPSRAKATPKISVIIPAYNCEAYIHRCIDSILNQSFQDFEIIAIDDGSGDNTLKELRTYQDPRIKVHYQKNQGAGVTRNRGIELSRGEKITFIDSDDCIARTFLATLLNKMGDNDMVVSGYKRYNGDKLLFTKVPQNHPWSPYKFSATCGKMFRADFLKQHKILFPTNFKIGEDLFFTLRCLAITDKIAISETSLYINYLNPNSTTSRANESKSSRNTDMQKLLQSIDEELGPQMMKDDARINFFLFFYLKTAVFYLLQQRFILNRKELYNEYHIFFSWLNTVYQKYGHKLQLHFQRGEELAVNLVCILFVIAYKTHSAKILLNLLRIIPMHKIQ